ncbi:MAG: hypothetical protein D6753_16885 [Planctomycetota bacterium]|nr:MAG: hypothetical protein D6753_16885 [Planctomycetota bacterium]
MLDELARLADDARRTLRWQALLLWLAWLLGTIALVVLLDMTIRREEVGLRVLSLMVVLGVAIGFAVRYLRPAWRFRPSALDVARWIERRRPEWGQRLSTFVELSVIPPDDPRFGSLEFRGEALAELGKQAAQARWSDCIDLHRLRRALMVCGAAAVSLGLLAAFFPQQTWLGVRRLVVPWAPVHWPRADQLELHRPPTAAALGTELQLEIIDRNPPLPDDVRIEFRPAGSDELEFVPATLIGEVAVANLPPLTQSIQVRGVGGDDDRMPWHTVEVVQPPELTDYRFVVTPPDYAAQSSREIIGRGIRVLLGSMVDFCGTFSEPVEAVTVEFSRTEGLSSLPEWQIVLDGDRRTFHLEAPDGPWRATHSVTWRLAVRLGNGLVVKQPEVWSIEVVDDLPPEVAMRHPPVSAVTEEVRFQIRGDATDDLGLQQIDLHARSLRAPSLVDEGSTGGADDEGGVAESIRLWEAEPGAEPPLERAVDLLWTPADSLPVAVGRSLEFWLEARDVAGQVGRSDVYRVEIRAPEEVLHAAEERQRELVDAVEQALELQRRNAQIVQRAAVMVEQQQAVDAATADALASATQIQNSVGQKLGDPDRGVLRQIDDLRTLLQQNGLEDSELDRALERLAREVAGVMDGELVQAKLDVFQAMRTARKDRDTGASPADATQRDLAQAMESQSALVDRLQGLFRDLSVAGAMQQMQRELLQIGQLQQRIEEDTRRLQLEAIEGLSREELKRRSGDLAADQQTLARQTDALADRMADVAPLDSDALETQRQWLNAAARTLADRQASSSMRTSADQLLGGDLARSLAEQSDASEAIDAALAELGLDSQQTQLANRARSLGEIEQELGQLAQQQQQLADSIRAGQQTEQSQQQQRDLQSRAAQQADQLDASGDRQSADPVRQAVDAQEKALDALGQAESERAADAAQAAAERLQQAAENVRQRARQAEQAAQTERAFQLVRELAQLVDRQRPIADALKQLGQRQAESRRDADWQAQVRRAAAEQQAVRHEAERIASAVQDAPAFGFAVQQATEAMGLAVLSAQRFRVDPEAMAYAHAALRKLELAAQAIQQQAAEDEQSEDEGSDRPDSEGANQMPKDPPLVSPIASLKLLRALQADLNARTRTIAAGDGQQADRARILAVLAAEQEALGKQVEVLVQQIEATSDANR